MNMEEIRQAAFEDEIEKMAAVRSEVISTILQAPIAPWVDYHF